MRIVITGATGLIGSALAAAAQGRGDTVVALSRDAARGRDHLGPDVSVFAWEEPGAQTPPAAALAGAGAVVHLLGEPVDQRWSAAARRRIRDSRVLSTRQLVAGLSALPEADRPKVLVCQSATGFYGASDDRELDESAPRGDDFLAGVVAEWEATAREAESFGRVVRTRTGVVLSSQGGALARMLPFFRAGIGGPVAGGRQFVPWIHLDDVAGALLLCATDDRLEGAVNVTAPEPVTNRQLSRDLGRVLHRPALLPVPGLALRALYGEMADIVLTGQRAMPRRLLAAGYEFAHTALEPALRAALSA